MLRFFRCFRNHSLPSVNLISLVIMGRTQSTLSPIERVPQECLMQILDQLVPSDAASAGSASRTLNISSEESLYRQIDIDWTQPPLKRVLSLFRVVHRRPDLAAHIRHIRMLSFRLEYPASDQFEQWYPPKVDGNWEQLSASFQSEVDAAKDIVSRAQFPSPHKWMQALDQGDPYAFVAIILSQLHNLRSLRLDYTFVWQSGFPGLMIRHALLSAPPNTLSKFSDLSIVEYGLNVPYSRGSEGDQSDCVFPEAFPTCDPDQFTGWFYLPSLQSLEIWLQNFSGVDLSNVNQLAKLKRLVIMESYIDETEVRDLLALLSSVESVHLGLIYPSQDEAEDLDIHSPRPPFRKQMEGALLEGLLSIGGTVKNLSISIELCPINLGSQWDEDDFGNIEEGLLPFQGFLKRLPHLETAELPAAMLFGWLHDDAPDLDKLLPSTLQKLAIRQNLHCVARDARVVERLSPGVVYEWRLDVVARAIQKFLPSAQSSTPLLKTIIIRDFEAEDSKGYIAQKETLAARSLCQDLGLGMHIAIDADSLPAGLWTASRELQEYVPIWRPSNPIGSDSPFC